MTDCSFLPLVRQHVLPLPACCGGPAFPVPCVFPAPVGAPVLRTLPVDLSSAAVSPLPAVAPVVPAGWHVGFLVVAGAAFLVISVCSCYGCFVCCGRVRRRLPVWCPCAVPAPQPVPVARAAEDLPPWLLEEWDLPTHHALGPGGAGLLVDVEGPAPVDV